MLLIPDGAAADTKSILNVSNSEIITIMVIL